MNEEQRNELIKALCEEVAAVLLRYTDKRLPTNKLVEELRAKAGVETHVVEPYKDHTVSVNGPAVILVVSD